jgi:hypothetical protein
VRYLIGGIIMARLEQSKENGCWCSVRWGLLEEEDLMGYCHDMRQAATSGKSSVVLGRALKCPMIGFSPC